MSKEAKLRELLKDSGISFKENSKSFILSCPKCSKPQKLYFRKSDARFVCWVCRESEGFSGAGEWGLTEVLGKPVSELKYELYGAVSYQSGPKLLDLDFDSFVDDEYVPFKPKLVEVAPDPGFRAIDSKWGKPGLEYLESRGINLEIALEYGLMYHPAQQHVIFPIYSQGKLLGWQGRYIGQTEYYDHDNDVIVKIPKVLSAPPGLKKDEVFMFGDRLNNSDHVVLCEGPIDGIKAHLCGGNVVGMGQGISDKQLNLIRNSGASKLYLALDPDAFMASREILKKMCGDIAVYNLWPKKGHKDLGSMTMEEVYEEYLRATRLSPAHLFVYFEDQ